MTSYRHFIVDVTACFDISEVSGVPPQADRVSGKDKKIEELRNSNIQKLDRQNALNP